MAAVVADADAVPIATAVVTASEVVMTTAVAVDDISIVITVIAIAADQGQPVVETDAAIMTVGAVSIDPLVQALVTTIAVVAHRATVTQAIVTVSKTRGSILHDCHVSVSL